MIRDVVLIGPLADKYGHEPIRFDCDDPWLLFSGLEAAYPGFKAELQRHDELALLKRVNGQIKSVSEGEYAMRFGSKADTIYVTTRTRGSAAAAAAWVANALATYGTWATVAAAITYVAVTVAITYAMGAVMKSLSDSPDPAQDRDKRESFLFNGARNIRYQGGAITKIYGKHLVGGTIISEEITTERLSMINQDDFDITAGGTETRNVMSNDILRERLTITAWTIDGTSRGVGYTHTVPESILPYFVDGEVPVDYPGSRDGYSFSLAADGTFTVTSQELVSVDHKLTYTVTDSADGSTATTDVDLQIRINSMRNNIAGGDGPSNEGSAAVGGGVSAGDANAGDGGTGGGDGSGSGGGTASA